MLEFRAESILRASDFLLRAESDAPY